MKREVLKYLFDMLRSVEILEQYSKFVRTGEQSEQDTLLFDAVQRRLMIAGEALYKAN